MIMAEKAPPTRAERTIDLLAEVDAYLSGDPNDPDVAILQAMLHIKDGQYDEATDHFSGLINKSETEKIGLVFRAYAHGKKNKLELALWDYIYFIRLELGDYFELGLISDTFIVNSETLEMFKTSKLMTCIEGEVHKLLLKMFPQASKFKLLLAIWQLGITKLPEVRFPDS